MFFCRIQVSVRKMHQVTVSPAFVIHGLQSIQIQAEGSCHIAVCEQSSKPKSKVCEMGQTGRLLKPRKA